MTGRTLSGTSANLAISRASRLALCSRLLGDPAPPRPYQHPRNSMAGSRAGRDAEGWREVREAAGWNTNRPAPFRRPTPQIPSQPRDWTGFNDANQRGVTHGGATVISREMSGRWPPTRDGTWGIRLTSVTACDFLSPCAPVVLHRRGSIHSHWLIIDETTRRRLSLSHTTSLKPSAVLKPYYYQNHHN